jgi:hypothetical protein
MKEKEIEKEVGRERRKEKRERDAGRPRRMVGSASDHLRRKV